MPEDGIAGDSYGRLIEDQLAQARLIKSSFEQRAFAVITTSGVLVSLLFGLAAVVTSAKTFQVPLGARVLLVIAVAKFLGAGIIGIMVNAPRLYAEPDPADLRRLIDPRFWEASAVIGSRRASELRVTVLEDATRVNRSKAILLMWAMIAEVAAVAFVAGAVVIILVSL